MGFDIEIIFSEALGLELAYTSHRMHGSALVFIQFTILCFCEACIIYLLLALMLMKKLS